MTLKASGSKGLIFFFALFAVFLSGCGDKQQAGPQGHGPAQVSVVEIIPTDQVLLTTLQGRTSPYMVAEVRPQVSGILQKRLFEEGRHVKEGEALYQIDPAVYQATLDSAKAELQRAEAVLYQSKLTAERYDKLIKTNAISRQQYDDSQAALKQAEAAVAAAEAQLKNAEINLEYTVIRSPIEGTIGRSLVTPGALLNGYQTNAMAVVQKLDPIYVDVNQSSRDILKLRHDIKKGIIRANEGKVPVKLILEDGTMYPHEGVLTLSEVSVDKGTGAVTLRAEFPNPEDDLLPGMYVRTLLPQGTRENALLVPQRSVMRMPNGSAYVYAVEDGKVVHKAIQTDQTSGTNWIVEQGVKPGDQIIIEGLQRIRPGMPVVIVPTIAEQAAKAAVEKQKKAADKK